MYGGLTENATLFDLSEYDKQMANEVYKPIDNETEAKVEVKQYKPVYFPKIDIDEDVLTEIAIASDGGMRDSLGMLDKLSSYAQKV